MNVAVLNIKDILKNLLKIAISIIVLLIFGRFFYSLGEGKIKNIINEIPTNKILGIIVPVLNQNLEIKEDKSTKILTASFPIISNNVQIINEENVEKIVVAEKLENGSTITINKEATTETVSERNFVPSYTDIIDTVKIDNQSDYDITEDMLPETVNITNCKDILIYHTHTCESYTPSENYDYEMTGNYRTTDNDYNVVRVGNELQYYLEKKGFSVIHDSTYHDYPAYSGSYDRACETANALLTDKDIQIVIDLHRDAMGDGTSYGPTIKVDGTQVAQLMFVIGTDGGGLQHDRWVENLKFAIEVQKTAESMYPGLFRPIIIRNSRYNQHLAKGASIIEVGATGNTLDECLLSMQCLANVYKEVLTNL